MDEALEILGRIGTDNAPTLAELTSARDTIARELHRLRSEGTSDLDALMTLRETYQAAAQAVTEAEAAAAQAAEAFDEVLDGVPNPDSAAEETAEEAPAATGRVLSVQEAVARLGLTTQVQTAPVAPEPTLADTATTVHLNGTRNDDATWLDMATAFQDASSRSRKVGKERVVRLETSFSPERTLSGRIADDTRLADSFLSPTAVSAAGGCCSLPTPIYENPVFSSTDRPIRDALPTLGASRGAYTFFPAVCLPDQGAALWTCEDDAAVDPDDETTWKQCLMVDCDTPEEVQVDAVYACLTVGNFQQRFAPEQWQAYLQAVSAYQARIAEVALFDKMRAAATTTHTLDATGSIYVTLLNGVQLAAATIRQDQRYTDIGFQLVLPGWVLPAVQSDLRSRRLSCAETIETTAAQVSQALSNDGISVIWSPDINPIEPDGQTDGPLSPYPDTASAVLFPEGSFSFLDGGTLDLGTEIRDHALNRQNMLAAFAESFEGLLARACNAKALDIPVEVCNDAPCPAGS
jgi:hypothetical protein